MVFFPVSKLLPSLLILNECHVFVWQRWRPIQGNVFVYGEVEKQWPQGNLPNYKNRCPLYKRTLVCIIFFLTRTKANKVWISEMQICSKQTRNNDITLIRIEEYVIMFPAKMFVNNLKKSFVFFSLGPNSEGRHEAVDLHHLSTGDCFGRLWRTLQPLSYVWPCRYVSECHNQYGIHSFIQLWDIIDGECVRCFFFLFSILFF